MSNGRQGSEARAHHESLYRKTVRDVVAGIRAGEFTEAAVPRHLEQLCAELAQCVELLLVSPEFYQEQMEIISREVKEVMQS